MQREFTGRHMAAIFIGGFGIVAAVNFYMASLATSGFHGIVVENSYVASQKFNDWLDNAEKMRALGWEANITRGEDGHAVVKASGVPADAVISAELRRPIGEKDFASLTFVQTAGGEFRSNEPLGEGRWTARLTITEGENVWVEETPLP